MTKKKKKKAIKLVKGQKTSVIVKFLPKKKKTMTSVHSSRSSMCVMGFKSAGRGSNSSVLSRTFPWSSRSPISSTRKGASLMWHRGETSYKQRVISFHKEASNEANTLARSASSSSIVVNLTLLSVLPTPSGEVLGIEHSSSVIKSSLVSKSSMIACLFL